MKKDHRPLVGQSDGVTVEPGHEPGLGNSDDSLLEFDNEGILGDWMEKEMVDIEKEDFTEIDGGYGLEKYGFPGLRGEDVHSSTIVEPAIRNSSHTQDQS